MTVAQRIAVGLCLIVMSGCILAVRSTASTASVAAERIALPLGRTLVCPEGDLIEQRIAETVEGSRSGYPTAVAAIEAVLDEVGYTKIEGGEKWHGVEHDNVMHFFVESLFADGSGGYMRAVDLSGADSWDVPYMISCLSTIAPDQWMAHAERLLSHSEQDGAGDGP